MKYRLLNKWYANFFGYFWLPCPVCHQMMGGHEWRDFAGKISSIPDANFSRGIGICQDCTKAGIGNNAWATQEISDGE